MTGIGWALLLLVSRAWAGTYWLETEPAVDRTSATALATSAGTDGHDGRVIRRFRAGAGWEYVVVVEGFADERSAQTAATVVANQVHQPISVFIAEGADARRVAVARPDGSAAAEPAPTPDPAPDARPEPKTEPAPAAVETPPSPPVKGFGKASSRTAEKTPAPVVAAVPTPVSADALVARAATALGGAAGGLDAVSKAPNVLFEFRRVVPNGPTARQTFARRGADVYLDVVIESGTGASSRSGIVGASAWLAQDGATSTEDLDRAREVLGTFAPERVLAFPLGFSAAVGRGDLAGLVPGADVTVAGHACHVAQDPAGGVTLAIDAADDVVRRVVFDAGDGMMTYEFDAYKTVSPGVIVPFRVKTWRGDVLVDDVEVLKFDPSAHLDESWFRAPAP